MPFAFLDLDWRQVIAGIGCAAISVIVLAAIVGFLVMRKDTGDADDTQDSRRKKREQNNPDGQAADD